MATETRTRLAKPGPAQVRLDLRGWLLTGPRGWHLGLDQCRGIVKAEIVDSKVPGVYMRDGVAFVIVWGGDRHEIARAVEACETPGMSIVLAWCEATLYLRLSAWLRWWWWRLRYPRPYGLLPKRAYRFLPRFAKASPSRAGAKTA